MRSKWMLLFALVAAVVLGDLAWAQQAAPAAMPGPPPVLQILMEHVKPGKATAHEKMETAWAGALKRAKFDAPGLAMTAISGSNTVWFVLPQKSWADAEKTYATMMATPAIASVMDEYTPREADMLEDTHSVWARYREDLSYNPHVKIGEMRFMVVRTVHVNLGHDDVYAQIRKMLSESMTRNNSPQHLAVYQVVGGGGISTYLVFRPIKSLAELDESSTSPMFNEADQKKFTELVEHGVSKVTQEIFAFSPGMSIPSADMIAAAPDYWNPKPAVAKGKAPAKAGESTPAAKKEPTKAEEKKK